MILTYATWLVLDLVGPLGNCMKLAGTLQGACLEPGMFSVGALLMRLFDG